MRKTITRGSRQFRQWGPKINSDIFLVAGEGKAGPNHHRPASETQTIGPTLDAKENLKPVFGVSDKVISEKACLWGFQQGHPRESLSLGFPTL